jgi:single-stranded DNA-binding protein
MNAVHLSGRIGGYGPRLTDTGAGKPPMSLTLTVEEPGQGGTVKTFVPVLIVGNQAEQWAETLEAGDLVAVSGRLQYKAGKMKAAAQLVVTGFTVEGLAPASAVTT